MSGWRSRLRSSDKPTEKDMKLAVAYRELFKRGEHSEMVLADLAAFTGFYSVAPPGVPSETLQYDAGMRAAFGRLFHFLSLSEDDMAALEQAARAESEHFNS